MKNKWIPLETQTAVTRLHVDLLAHGWVVDVRHKHLNSIPVGQAGRAKRIGEHVVVEEVINNLLCIRTVYADTYCRVEMNDMSL